MYSRLVIGEYSGQGLCLLFSYPVSRKKVFHAKVLVVVSFVFVSMLLCTAVSIIIFTVTENINPILSDTMTVNLLAEVIIMAIASIFSVNAIGLLSLSLGMIKNSIPAALVCSFVLSGIYGNMAVSAAGNPSLSFVTGIVSLVIIFLTISILSRKINQMEVC